MGGGELADALQRTGADGDEVVAADRDPAVDAGRLAEAGVEVHAGNEEDRLLDGVELVIKSPGVPGESALPAAARTRGTPIWREVEFGYRLLRSHPFVGVTGTNGKTTTAELLGAIFRAAGRPVVVAGNVGRPLTGFDGAIPDDSWIVCELSSFQLEDVHELACDVAVLLNLEPDHLDRHGTFEAYRDAKLRILERARVKVVPRGLGLAGIAVAATAAARAAGIEDHDIAEALRAFAGVEHRLELVAEIDGVRYVNDSKATNTAAARRGIAAYASEPLRLILGGSLKGESFDELVELLPPT